MRIVGLLLMAYGLVAIVTAFPSHGGTSWNISVISALFVVGAVVAGAVLVGCGAIVARLPKTPAEHKPAAEIAGTQSAEQGRQPLPLDSPLSR